MCIKWSYYNMYIIIAYKLTKINRLSYENRENIKLFEALCYKYIQNSARLLINRIQLLKYN